MPDQDKFEFLTPSILHDLPLREDDEAHFHFDRFAVTLARLIASKKTRTPLTIGVSGSWGSGKTTLLRRTQILLDQTGVLRNPEQPATREKVPFLNEDENPQELYRSCRTVWFNAWKYADEDTLLVALVRVIVQAMFSDDFISKGAAAILEPFTPRRNVIDTVLSWFSIKVGNTEVVLSTGEPKETPFAEKTAMLDLFDDAFDRLLAAWVHRKLDAKKLDPEQGVLVVFIDDLDRCLPAKTVQVLEAVKLFLDKPGCVFVLGADIAHVERAVTAHYQGTGVVGETASDYLEKIIQLRFPLPPIEMHKMGNFVSAMKVGDTHLISEEWGDSWKLLITGAELNPRKVKTIMNDLSLQWAMLVNIGKATEVNRQDFNAWQVLMRIAPRNFVVQVRDNLDDQELRFKFVMEAMEWVKGNQDVAGNYREYDGSYRLKRVLRQLSFSDTFDAATLEAFIHLAAPPAVEVLPAVVEEKGRKGEGEKRSAAETGVEIGVDTGIETDQEALVVKGVTRGERGQAKPREGVQTWGGIEFVRVPKGRFLMGSKEENKLASDGEKPQHTVELSNDYWIGRYPVTNEQFNMYVRAKGLQHPVKDWQKKKDHPVVNVAWQECMAYCVWLNQAYQAELAETGKNYIFRLPTEAEWEKAARGEYGNEWPWGNEWDAAKCNSSEGKAGGTTPVGAYSPQGDSPYGAADMVGNVWEYTHSLWKGYPYKVDDGREDEGASGLRVVRGGSFGDYRQFARAAARAIYILAFVSRGLRVCVAPKLS